MMSPILKDIHWPVIVDPSFRDICYATIVCIKQLMNPIIRNAKIQEYDANENQSYAVEWVAKSVRVRTLCP